MAFLNSSPTHCFLFPLFVSSLLLPLLLYPIQASEQTYSQLAFPSYHDLVRFIKLQPFHQRLCWIHIQHACLNWYMSYKRHLGVEWYFIRAISIHYLGCKIQQGDRKPIKISMSSFDVYFSRMLTNSQFKTLSSSQINSRVFIISLK